MSGQVLGHQAHRAQRIAEDRGSGGAVDDLAVDDDLAAQRREVIDLFERECLIGEDDAGGAGVVGDQSGSRNP